MHVRTAAAIATLVMLAACGSPSEPTAPVIGDSANACGGLAGASMPTPSGAPPSDELVQAFTDSIVDEPWFNGSGLSRDEDGYVLLVFAEEDTGLPKTFRGVPIKVCEVGRLAGS